MLGAKTGYLGARSSVALVRVSRSACSPRASHGASGASLVFAPEGDERHPELADQFDQRDRPAGRRINGCAAGERGRTDPRRTTRPVLPLRARRELRALPHPSVCTRSRICRSSAASLLPTGSPADGCPATSSDARPSRSPSSPAARSQSPPCKAQAPGSQRCNTESEARRGTLARRSPRASMMGCSKERSSSAVPTTLRTSTRSSVQGRRTTT